MVKHANPRVVVPTLFLLIVALLIGVAFAQQNAIKRTILEKQEFPGSQWVTVTGIAEIAPGGMAARHTHPGIENAYILDGEGSLKVMGQPERMLKAGDSFQIANTVPHSLRNLSSERPLKVISTWVVDKDKPLATPAPE
jgi:quercetin dioxygenase-like cupin family protein